MVFTCDVCVDLFLVAVLVGEVNAVDGDVFAVRVVQL